MKVLVTGVTGQLGYDVASELSRRGIEHKGVGSKDMDLTDAKLVYISTDYVFSGEGDIPFAYDRGYISWLPILESSISITYDQRI